MAWRPASRREGDSLDGEAFLGVGGFVDGDQVVAQPGWFGGAFETPSVSAVRSELFFGNLEI